MLKSIIFSTTLFSILFSNFVFAGNVSNGPKIDIAELQWSLCESPESVIQKLELDHVKYTNESQSYLDSKALVLLAAGLQIRIREKNSSINSALKLKFMDINDIPKDFYKSDKIICEYDKYSDLEKIGCKIKNSTTLNSEFLSDLQKFYLNTYAPNIKLSDFVSHGPFIYETWSAQTRKNQSINFDNITAKNGLKFPEISIRVKADDRDKLFAYWSAYLQSQQIVICKEHINRTKIVLESN